MSTRLSRRGPVGSSIRNWGVIPPPSGGGTAKATAELKITPGYEPVADPGTNYQSNWLGWYEQRQRNLDRLINDQIYGAMMLKIPSTWPLGPNAGVWPPVFQDASDPAGKWGRIWNFHNNWNEPEGDVSSAEAMDFINGNLSWNCEPNPVGGLTDFLIIPYSQFQFDHWYTIAIDLVLGRTSGTPRQGSLKIWADGVQKINMTGINTVYLTLGYIQRYMWMWAGFYTKALYDGRTDRLQITYPFIGSTIAEMKADAVGGTGGSSHLSDQPISGRNISQGPATTVYLPSRTSGDLILPAGW